VHSWCTSLIVGCTLAAAGVAAQSGPAALNPARSGVFNRSEAVPAFAGWVSAVLQHQPGVVDAAVIAAAQLSPDTLNAVFVEIIPLRKLMVEPRASSFSVPNDGKRLPQSLSYSRQALERMGALARMVNDRSTDERDFFELAALLHTDVALHPEASRDATGGANSSSLSRFSLQFGDGTQTGLAHSTDHMLMARQLLEYVARGTNHDPDIRRWYQATIARQQADQFWDFQHTDDAVKRFPDAPELLFLEGCLHEVAASPGVHAVIERASLPRGARLLLGNERDELRKAATGFKRVIDLMPAFAEARLHYGHVLVRLREWDQALTALRGMSAAVREPELKYFAAMFLGDAAEGAGRIDDAQTAYLDAAALFPSAPSPKLALSHLAWQTGNRAAARDHLQPILATVAHDRTDPLWSYMTSQARQADAWLADAQVRLATPGPALKP
jgi:tetratricopeptide (TPR) repeat protein